MLHKIFFIILLISLYQPSLALDNDDIRIYSKDFPLADTVDFGIAFVGDAINHTFIIENNSPEDIYITDVAPSILIAPSDFEPYEQTNDSAFQHAFFDATGNRNIIKGNSSFQINVKFRPSYYFNQRDTLETGYFEAKLSLGVLEKADTNKALYETNFILLGHSTIGFLSSLSTKIDFDSVLVNPPLAIESKLKVRNNWTKNLHLMNDNFEILTTKQNFDELKLEEKLTPVNIVKKTILEYELSYYPIDLGFDHARYSATYNAKEHEANDDSLAYFEVDIYGFGAKQDLHLNYVNSYNYTHNNDRDTIFIGHLLHSESINLNAQIINKGNINFQIPEPTYFSSSQNVSSTINTLLKNNIIEPDSTRDISLKISPNNLGEFQLIYSIPSDIKSRKINGTSDYHNKKDIVIKGIGLAPLMTFQNITDSIDFGSITSNDKCNQFSEKNINLYNQGNYELQIDSIWIDYPIGIENSFSFIPQQNKISSGSYTQLNVRFMPTISGNYSATVNIKTNEPIPHRTIVLSGNSIDDIEKEILVSSAKAKPGNIISIPIITKNNSINIANSFSGQLFYDLSHLNFIDAITTNTATENSKNNPETSFLQNENGLSFNIKMNTNENLKLRDTIIIFKFDTYLGHSTSSQIELSNPMFGNKDCEDLFMLKSPVPGEFEIIGISNREKKAFKDNSLAQNIFPNPNPGEFKLLSSYNDLTIEVYDSDGEKVQIETSKRNNEIDIKVKNFKNGLYLIRLQRQNISQSHKILLIK